MSQVIVDPTRDSEENSESLSFLPTKVDIHNTRIDIINSPSDYTKHVDRPLSVYDTYSKWPRVLWRAITSRWENGNHILSIPRYVPKKFITENLNCPITVINEESYEVPKIDYEFKGAPNSDLQRHVISYLFNDRWELKKRTRIIDLPVGNGKTFLSLFAAAKLGVKCNIFVHKTPMIDTPWKKDIAQFTGIKPEEIFVIQGASSFEKALKNKDKYKIFITLHRTMENYLDCPNAYEKLNNLYKELGIGLNIIDEAHKEIFSTFLISMYCEVRNTIYLTATLSRTNREDERIFRYLISVNESFAANNFVQPQKFVTYRPRPFTSDPSEKWIKAMANETGVKMSKYCEYLCTEEQPLIMLYEKIVEAIGEIRKDNPEAHIAILLGTLELVQKIYDGLSSDFDPGTIGNFTSLISSKNRYKELEKPIILSTDKSMDSAIDCSVDALILCVPITSEIQVTQIVGRIRYKEEGKTYPVYDIQDTAFKKSAKNFQVRSHLIKKNIAEKVEKA